MRVLISFPGKFGDLLWMLPSARALARRLGHPVDLVIADDMKSLVPLLLQQPYLGKVWAEPAWKRVHVDVDDRIPPVSVRDGYYAVANLGYRGWPKRPLPCETLDCLNEQLAESLGYMFEPDLIDADLALHEPWITAEPWDAYPRHDVLFGWSDEHFELKVGLTTLLRHQQPPSRSYVLAGPGRWVSEAGVAETSWLEDARRLLFARTRVFVGCCSGLHVLAVACGVPVVMMEPSEARWNDIFFPLGKSGRVHLVLGNDGRPTFDARAVQQAIEAALQVAHA